MRSPLSAETAPSTVCSIRRRWWTPVGTAGCTPVSRIRLSAAGSRRYASPRRVALRIASAVRSPTSSPRRGSRMAASAARKGEPIPIRTRSR
jgi:hypothetical protein